MCQSLDTQAVSQLEPFLCAYRNQTNAMQMVRITNSQRLPFEKIVFPGELVLLEAVPEAQLEVYVGSEGRAALLKCVACSRLRITMKSGGSSARATT